MLAPYSGRGWKLPDGVSSDQLIASKYAFDFDPEVLRLHLLEDVDPTLAGGARCGDLIVAGANFANGSIHSHPFIAMKAMRLGMLCRSIPRGAYRLAVFFGVPLLTIDIETYDAISNGDALEVDFRTGRIDNRSTGRSFAVEPLPTFLMEIVEAGGGLEHAQATQLLVEAQDAR